MYVLIFAVAAGVFGYWINTKKENHSENGILVKSICKEENA